MQLRDYQSNAVKWICDQCERGQNPLFCCATGGGKTYCMSAAIKELAKIHRLKTGKNARFLSLVHRTEIHESNFATLKRVAPEITATKIDATQKNFRGQVHFASVQTLQRIVEKLAFYPNNRYDYVLVDECFIPRTPIKTKSGIKPIEKIQAGELVLTLNENTNLFEYKPVQKLIKRLNYKKLVKINTSIGSFVCTEDHKLFTKNGWTSAKDCDSVMLYTTQEIINEMQYLRNGYIKSKQASNFTGKSWKKSLLFERMYKFLHIKNFFDHDGKYEQKICVCSNENQQPNEKTRNPSKSFNIIKNNGMETASSWWKRNWSNITTKTVSLRSWVGNGISCLYSKCEIIKRAKLLQTRYSKSISKNWDRSRWGKPLFIESARKGQEENHNPKWIRVESVEIQKRRSYRFFGFLCRKNYVYDLTVKDNHNYIAGGVLVHNCHHGLASSYIKIINGLLSENGRIIGVSATPNRGDKRPLDVLFQSAYVVTTGDLIRQHWLCSPICRDFSKKFKNLKPKKENTNPKFQESQTLTLSQNFTRARNQRNADAAVKLVSDCVPDLLKAIESRNKVIVFVPNHSFGQILFDSIKDKISSDYLRDGISGDDRRISFARFENGQTKVLINVDIATEGYDCPAIDCVVDFDTNGSEGQWVQKIGRGLRLADGKNDCLVLDFGCNLEKYPDLEQKCNLSGEIKEKAGGGFGFFTGDDTPAERVEIAQESCDSQNGVEVKMYHNESAGLYFFSWGNYYVGVGNDYVCVQFNDRFHEFVRTGESLEYLGSVEDVSKLTAVSKLNDIDIPANNIQISLLSPRYSTANLRKNEARALIFWDSWKKEIINKIKTPI